MSISEKTSRAIRHLFRRLSFFRSKIRSAFPLSIRRQISSAPRGGSHPHRRGDRLVQRREKTGIGLQESDPKTGTEGFGDPADEDAPFGNEGRKGFLALGMQPVVDIVLQKDQIETADPLGDLEPSAG